MNKPAEVSVVIAVFNQLSFTQGCVESLNRAGIAGEQIIIVNNASTDGTAKFLALRPEIRVIHNENNLGCGPAWTQGSQAAKSTWIVVMNNDVLVPPDCIEGLVHFAGDEKFDVVSPALCEGDADYDFLEYSGEFMRTMASVRRRNVAHGVCFMVHRRVFETVGHFGNLGGYEDDDFFRRARRAKFRLATTGRAFLHHFGSVTQKSIKTAQKKTQEELLGNREVYRRKTGQTWIKRKTTQIKTGVRDAWWQHSEYQRYGHTLHELRIGGTWRYK